MQHAFPRAREDRTAIVGPIRSRGVRVAAESRRRSIAKCCDSPACGLRARAVLVAHFAPRARLGPPVSCNHAQLVPRGLRGAGMASCRDDRGRHTANTSVAARSPGTSLPPRYILRDSVGTPVVLPPDRTLAARERRGCRGPAAVCTFCTAPAPDSPRNPRGWTARKEALTPAAVGRSAPPRPAVELRA